MEMKYVVPDMAQSFGTLEFAGESEPIFERDKNNRKVIARRSYNLYSDVQKGENVVHNPGVACILKLILFSWEGLQMRKDSHTQEISCEPSPNE